MELAVAMNDRLGQRTSSPAPTPAVISARWSAVVQEETAMACFAPTYSANRLSNSATRGPWVNHPLRNTSRTAVSSSLPTKGSATGMVVLGSVVKLIVWLQFPRKGVRLLRDSPATKRRAASIRLPATPEIEIRFPRARAGRRLAAEKPDSLCALVRTPAAGSSP